MAVSSGSGRSTITASKRSAASRSQPKASVCTSRTRGSSKAPRVEFAQPRLGTGQPHHGRVELDQGHRRHVRVAQHLPQRQPVTGAEDQHVGAAAGENRVHQRLVVAVLVGGAELQVAVEVEAQVARLAGVAANDRVSTISW